MIHHIKRTTKTLIFLALVISAVVLTAIRLLLPVVEQYHQRIEQELSALLNAPVKIGKIGTNMRGLQPELVFTNIAIAKNDAGQTAIKLKEIRVSIDFLTALGHWDLFSAGRVTLVGAELYVKRKPDGSLAVEGLKSGDEQPLWLLRGGNFAMIQSQVTWHDQLLQSPPRRFDNIDIAISNDYLTAQHTIHVRVNPSAELAGSLRLSLQLTGDIFAANGITGLAYLETNSLDINSFINDRLPESWQLDAKPTDVKLWARWQQSQLLSLSGYLDLSDIRLTRPEVKELVISHIATALNWQRQGQKWRLDLARMLLSDGDKQWPEINLSLLLDDSLSDNPKVGLSVAQIDLGAITHVANLLPTQKYQQLDLFKRFQAQGQLRDFLLYVDSKSQTWAVKGGFDQLNIKAVDDLPGITQLTGHIRGSHTSGRLTLASQDLALSSPSVFQQAILISQLQGHFDWQHIDQQWHVSSDDWVLETAIIKTRNRGRLVIPENLNMEAAFVDIQSHFFDGDLAKIKAYLPLGSVDKELMAWLNRAFVRGQIRQGTALFYGQINDYPFASGNGVFALQFDGENIELDYDQDWPHFTDVDAHFDFHNGSMTITAKQWRLNGMTLTDTSAHMASLARDDHISVRTKIKGKIEYALGFLQRTPLQSTLAPVTKLIKVTGENVIDLTMKLPVVATAAAKVDGVTRFNKAKIQLLAADILVENMSGEIHFNERGLLTKKTVAAEALGHSIGFTIAQDKQATTINVTANPTIKSLQKQFSESPWWAYAQGRMQYDLAINIPVNPATSSKLTFFSDLNDISLRLPGTLAKVSGQKRNLTITAELNDSVSLPIRLNYANRLQAALLIEPKQQQLLSSEILLGSGRVDFLKPGKNKLKINQPTLTLDPWLSFSDRSEPGQGGGNWFDNFNEVDIDIGQLLWQAHDFNSLTLQLGKENELWLGAFASSFGAGRVNFTKALSTAPVVDLDLDFIDLSTLNQISTNNNQAMVGIKQQPKINLKSQRLLWHNVDLGRLNMQLVSDDEGTRINNFEVKGKGNRLSLKGNWISRKNQLNTVINGELKVKDLGGLLSRLDINKEMQGSKSEFVFSLTWPGAPYQFDLAKVKGDVNAELEQGSLLGIEPGFGRILGAFDLAEWKRRISLDFSDVVSEGLAYNSIKGKFYFSEGSADIANLTIDGVSAKIEISGRTGLVAQDYDQIVTVTPKSTAVIPFAGTIAGLVVKTITGSHPDSLTSSQYEIKGSWEQPEIFEKHENDGVLRKVWSGITGFAQSDKTK